MARHQLYNNSKMAYIVPSSLLVTTPNLQPVVAVGEEVDVVRLVVVRLLQPVGRRRLERLLLGDCDVPLLDGISTLGCFQLCRGISWQYF